MSDWESLPKMGWITFELEITVHNAFKLITEVEMVETPFNNF